MTAAFSPRAAYGDAPHSATAPTEFATTIMERQPLKGYSLQSCLAASDRSAVFKADDRTMERAVAVKVVRPWAGREGAVEEFFSLAGSIARLRCPGAARGLDAGRCDGDFFLAYEFLPGETLAAKLARRQTGRLTEKESLRLAGETARVLQSLFELGHPHGWLKPSNIMMGEGGKIVLTDIGFAWNVAWPDDASAFASAPDFLAPERIAGELNVDVRGDLYSLGAILYFSLMGAPVLHGATPEETLRLHLESKPVPPREIDPRLSAATSELVLWLLEKERDARPRTPRDFLRKLKGHPLLSVESEGEGSLDAEISNGEPGLDQAGGQLENA